jgi:hypothetical protein
MTLAFKATDFEDGISDPLFVDSPQFGIVAKRFPAKDV